MSMDSSLLKKIGLSDKEILTYLNLLEYGPISVRALAELTGINRGTTYDTLKKLQEDGLASYYHSATKQKFVAEEPEKLLSLVEAKEREWQNIKTSLSDLVPELKALEDRGEKHPTSKLYEGRSGVRFILDDVLSTMKSSKENEYYVYSAEGVREDLYNAYPEFTDKRIRSEIKVNTISLSPGGTTYGMDSRKWLANDKKMGAEMTYGLIYSGKCAFISRDVQNNPVGVIIENQMIYETQKIIFKQLWRFLENNNG